MLDLLGKWTGRAEPDDLPERCVGNFLYGGQFLGREKQIDEAVLPACRAVVDESAPRAGFLGAVSPRRTGQATHDLAAGARISRLRIVEIGRMDIVPHEAAGTRSEVDLVLQVEIEIIRRAPDRKKRRLPERTMSARFSGLVRPALMFIPAKHEHVRSRTTSRAAAGDVWQGRHGRPREDGHLPGAYIPLTERAAHSAKIERRETSGMAACKCIVEGMFGRQPSNTEEDQPLVWNSITIPACGASQQVRADH